MKLKKKHMINTSFLECKTILGRALVPEFSMLGWYSRHSHTTLKGGTPYELLSERLK